MTITILYTFIIIAFGLMTNMQDSKSRNRYILFSCIILVVISGCRSIWIGTDDTYIYSQAYSDSARMTYQQIKESFNKDVFYYITNHFIAKITGENYHLLLIIFAIFYMGCLCFLLKNESPNPLVSFIVFLSMGYFSFQMNGVRQGIAIAFTMLAYIPLKNRQFKLFLFWILLGSLYHKTCLIFLIAYPLSYIKLNTKAILAYSGIVILCLLFGQNLLNAFINEAANYDTRFSSYQLYQAKATYSGLIQLLLLAAFSFNYYKRVILRNPQDMILYTMLILAIIFQSMAIFIAEMFRISMYFNIFLILLLPKVFDAIPTIDRQVLSIGLCVLLLVYFFFLGTGKLPYYFYWSDTVIK